MSKPHYFELVMNSYSNGELNQEVVVVREYANTPSELAMKQMGFTRSAAPKIIDATIAAMDELSMPLQEQGIKEVMEQFAEFTKTKPKPKAKSSK